jgi:pimeloyl-ACP methyl ester carboxylesterase
MVLLFALPLVMLLAAGVAAITAHHDFSRSVFRALRYVLGTEVLFVVVIATVGAIYQATSTSREQRLYPPPGQLVDIGGYRLHLYCSGEGGPTVILDYGRVGSYLDWYYVQPQVARFTRVCSYDRGGYGWSDPSPKPRLPSVMAEELHTLLAKAGEEPPYVLVGHSFGSFDALMYAHKYRQEVAGVVLVDGAHPDEHLPFHWRDKLWLRIMQLTAPFGLPRWRRWCGGGPAEIAPIKTAIFCRSHVFRTNYDQWTAFSEGAEEVRKLSSFENLPLHVLSRDPDRRPGSDDPTFSSQEQHWLKLQRELLQLSTNATHTIATRSGHEVMTDRPDVIVEAIRKIVEKASKSGL